VIALAIISGRSVFDIANLRSRDLRTTIDPPVLRFPCDDQSQYPGDDYDIHPLLVEYLFLRNLSKDPASFLFPSLASRPSEGPNGLEAEFVELIDVSGIERLSASGITADGCRRFEEYTASSLEHALPHEEVDLILRSAFQVRTKRQFPQEKIIPASQPASPQQSAPQPARWFPPSRGTRTI
jgi:hypothetical protein